MKLSHIFLYFVLSSVILIFTLAKVSKLEKKAKNLEKPQSTTIFEKGVRITN